MCINVYNYIKEQFYTILYLLFLSVSMDCFLSLKIVILLFLITTWNFTILLLTSIQAYFQCFVHTNVVVVYVFVDILFACVEIYLAYFQKWDFWIKFPFKNFDRCFLIFFCQYPKLFNLLNVSEDFLC